MLIRQCEKFYLLCYEIKSKLASSLITKTRALQLLKHTYDMWKYGDTQNNAPGIYLSEDDDGSIIPYAETVLYNGVEMTGKEIYEIYIKDIDEYYNKMLDEINATAPQSTSETIPPVIQAMIDAGFLEKDCDTNGKRKPIEKKDTELIRWIFNYSGYADDLTTEIYKNYVYTNNLASTIDRYISECRNETK